MSFDNAPRREHDDLGNLIHSKAVRAGKRTYFIDVKSTRDDDYFITITESRKRHDGDGASSFARQQLHLYKEDFDKFIDGLEEIVDFIKSRKPDYFEQAKRASIDEEFDKL
jgi:hypothetical protein